MIVWWKLTHSFNWRWDLNLLERKGEALLLPPLTLNMMTGKLDSPVQTQMAVAVLNSPCNSGCHIDNGPERKLSGSRRLFVQTECGCVLDMESDRGDNAQTVKRRLQLVLNVPTDETLTFGDKILNNDLSAVRNDSPFLLTRNLMHGSSSTPSLSPTGKSLQQRDYGGIIEILGCLNHFARTNELVKEIVKAIKNGVDPIPISSGLGGSYYFTNIKGESVAIVKPTDEEPLAPNNPKGFLGKALGQPGLKRSVRVGETGFREVAAYLLDYDHFANVPPTALVKITHSIFNVNDGVNGNKSQKKKMVSKIASLQHYIRHDFDAGDYGTSSFPVAAVHRIGILDVRIFNTDRHAGNILVRKLDGIGRFGQVDLIPIDHGLCLPEALEDPYFEWIHWPQASIPFSEDELEYIRNLDPVSDSEMLRTELPMIREACLRILTLSTIFLKEATDFGLCLAEIGGMMSREFRGHVEEPSELEIVCLEARRIVAEKKMLFLETELMDREIQFDLDLDDAETGLTPKMSRESLNKASFSFERIEEEEIDAKEVSSHNQFQTVSELSTSLKNFGLGEKSKRQERSPLVGTSDSIRRSAKELLPSSTTFVKLADMSKEEWFMFLDKFQELLYPAFANRKSSSIGQRQRLRLGTSCQF
ncbi:Phosphatidylinositol 4-kinase gamma 7 [Camellia lanceoleosa]|uniref:Phosphatidylinositol 4-kinase gamma 7 n=1 Tax=Camellia lanceoleosa TaxID=1840588 RepID=A0ACC0I2J3_9ERIC|nr:Phosphatidylinositol 4-kinase gamma 7 [Camellia lanceoleosa]